MQIITHNPYRILGILVNATAREQNKQIQRLKQYLEAEQQPPVDFSFPVIGAMNRTVESITDAASKLNLDSDKMNAALFWFWKGNEITDEPAFDALKEGNINSAIQIWEKLILETKADGKRYWKAVTNKNYSAFHNWFILQFLNKTNWTLMANLKFLESVYWQKLKEQVTDNTYNISKKELQLMFLNSLIAEDKVNISDVVKIIKDMDFSAKQDFLKNISQKFTANINSQIETARKVCAANKQKAVTAGETLYKNTKDDLAQLKEFFGIQDFSYSNVIDKVANEILQCSIDFFNDSQDKELNNNYHEKAMQLAKLAQGIAVGNMVKERIKDDLQTLEQMKDKEILQAIEVFKMIKKAYDNIKFDWNRSINTYKVNKLLKKVLTPYTIKKIELCSSYSLLNEYTNLLDTVIRRSCNYNWLRTHYNKIVIIIEKQKLFEELSLKTQSYPTDKFKNIRRVIDILKLLENYSLKFRKEIITEEITDNIIISIAQCGNSSLINEFYEHTAINVNLRKRTEKIFIKKLPDDSTLKVQIEIKKEKERIASLWYNKPKKWNDLLDNSIIVLCIFICTVVGIIGGGIWTSIEKGHFITGAIIGALISVVLVFFIGFIVNYFIYIIYRFIAFIVRKKSRKD
jgi:hypothetical protein